MGGVSFSLTGEDVFETNPEFKALPEFERLTSRQMRYVMLVDWYGSPLRLMKIEDRKLKAAYQAGYRNEKDTDKPDSNTRNLIAGKVGTVEAARKLMKDIQHDSEMDLKEALDIQIDEVISYFKRPDKSAAELEKAVALMVKLPTILETKRKILELLNFREPSVVIDEIKEETSETSFLESYNENH